MKRTSGLAVLLLLAACGGDGTMMMGSVDATVPRDSAGSSDGPAVTPPDMAPPAVDMTPGVDSASSDKLTVFTIVLENHDYAEIVGSSYAPYINQLIAQYGLATNYTDSTVHPSLPNYLEMVSGDPQYPGLLDCDPAAFCISKFGNFPVDKDNLGHQLTAANIPWRSYQEDMVDPCRLTSNGHYAPKHDPFLYFTNIQKDMSGLCAATNVDYTNFAADLAAGQYRYMWITPNLINDGHDGEANAALKVSDDWCALEIPKIMASNAYKHGGIIFLTWDEGAGRAENTKSHIPMIVISEKIHSHGYQSGVAYNHASYLATVEDLFSLPRLGHAVMAPTMTEFWQ